MGNAPSTTGANGRDTGGRFAPGNKLAKGNPIARRTHRMRQAISKAATPEQAVALLDSLYEAATDNENAVKDRIAAARLWLSYTVGPPRDVEQHVEQQAAPFTFIFTDNIPEYREAVENLAQD